MGNQQIADDKKARNNLKRYLELEEIDLAKETRRYPYFFEEL